MEIIVAREGRHGGHGARRELGAVESAGVQAGLAHWIDARNSGLPASNLGHGVEHLTRRLRCLVVANHGNTPVIGVEAAHVGALYGLVQTAVAAFVDGAELIHQHVVSDIAPAQVLRMILVGAAYLCRCLCAGVVIGTRGVVEGHGLQAIVVGWLLAALRFVCAPAGAGDHLGHARGFCGGLDGFAFLGVAVDKHGVEIRNLGALVGHGGDIADVVRKRRGAVGISALGGLVQEGVFLLVEVGTGHEVNVGHRDLHIVGIAHEDELGAVLALGVIHCIHGQPFAPGTVLLLGADEGVDISLALPGDGEHVEGFVAVELLDRTAAFAVALCGYGWVINDDGFAVTEARGGIFDLNGAAVAGVLGLENLLSAECGRYGERDGGDRRDDGGGPL